jgi:peptide/nickel transport system ATP-binding protein
MNTSAGAVLRVEGVGVTYGSTALGVRAAEDVSFTVAAGETVGLVGESGSGKTTIARTILGLVEPSAGTLVIDGEVVSAPRSAERRRQLARVVQAVFQDPYNSLNPSRSVALSISEPLRVVKPSLGPAEVATAIRDSLRLVGLRPEIAAAYPHSLSGGQRQRAAIARALIVRPSLVLLDEPVSALDLSSQAQVLNVLRDLQDELGLSYLLISHDLGVIRYLCSRVLVMYRGRIVETGAVDDVVDHPLHPYTRSLVLAAPIPDPRRQADRREELRRSIRRTEQASASGCRFAPRCVHAAPICVERPPEMRSAGGDHCAACVLVDPLVRNGTAAPVGSTP